MASPQQQEGIRLNCLLFGGPYSLKKDREERILATSFPSPIEEITSIGAVDVAVPDMYLLPDEIDRLTPTLRKRVTKIDNQAGIVADCDAVLRPVCERFGLEFALPPHFIYRSREDPPREVLAALPQVFNLCPLSLGLKCQLTVSIDLDETRRIARLARDVRLQ